MFASQSRSANFWTFALVLALALTGLFVARTQSFSFYNAGLYYVLGIFGLVVLVTAFYLGTLRPQSGREEEGTLNWFFGRATGVGLAGTLLAVVLATGYLTLGDDSFSSRQLAWEAQKLRDQKLPEEMVEMLMEGERNQQRLHVEEGCIGFFGALSAVVGGLTLACVYFSVNRRNPPRLQPLPVAG